VEVGTEASGTRGAEAAYDAIAPVYDEFTAQNDYELVLASLLPELERRGLSGNRLLDVGCGTGESFIGMLDRGWEVTGCDISPAMVELARSKVGERARLAVADMVELPEFGEFDLVWALDDAVSYLLSVEDLEAALAGMAANLGPRGLLAFDVNTLLTYRTFFAEERVVESGGRRLVWRGRAAPDTAPGSICEASFEVVDDDSGAQTIPAETHRQRHFPPEVVIAALRRVGLECLGVYGYGADVVLRQPLDESRHAKALFIARLDQTRREGGEP
jgi:SAM-dependent methyltransferase